MQEAITEYQGTVITVSHDRYFIKQIVNRVLEVKDGTLQDYDGDYEVSLAYTSYYYYCKMNFQHLSTSLSLSLSLVVVVVVCVVMVIVHLNINSIT